MPSSKYKVFAIGGPVGEGVTQSIHVGIAAIAKKSSTRYPYVVCNELICASIARALLLPCPPGAILEHNGEQYFFSLDFNHAGQALPPVNADAVVSTVTELSWGIILFDILVMNPDRHRKNISFDSQSRRVQLFDHSHALLGSAPDIQAHLQANANGLGLAGRHCLANRITSRHGMDTWLGKIASLPDYFFEDLIRSATDVGLPADAVAPVADFLKNRRDNLRQIVEANIQEFRNLQQLV